MARRRGACPGLLQGGPIYVRASPDRRTLALLRGAPAPLGAPPRHSPQLAFYGGRTGAGASSTPVAATRRPPGYVVASHARRCRVPPHFVRRLGRSAPESTGLPSQIVKVTQSVKRRRHVFSRRRQALATGRASCGACLPDLDVFPQNARPGFACEHVAELVDRAELRPASSSRTRIAALIEDEMPHPAVERVPDPDPLLKTRIVDVVRLRVEDIDQVFIIDREGDPARHPELVPPRQIGPILIEDLDPRIRPVAHEQPAPLVHGNAVRDPELARTVSGLSPGLDELPILRILHDPDVREMAIGDENIAVGSGHDAGRGPEMVLIVAADPRLAERHQHLSIRAELAHDVPGLD